MMSTLRQSQRAVSGLARSAAMRSVLPAVNARVLSGNGCQPGCSCRGNITFCGKRSFSSASPAVQRLQKGLQDEHKYEQDNYQKPEKELPAGWKLTDVPGDVNLKIEKELSAGRVCKVEWQLMSPYEPEVDEMEGEGEQPVPEGDETDFTITVETKEGAQGMTFFCNTQNGEGHRFVIGNVKTWTSADQKDNAGAYNGPDFEDLEEKLTDALDEYLGEIGIGTEICDYIEAGAVDKEHREYMQWLNNMKTIIG